MSTSEQTHTTDYPVCVCEQERSFIFESRVESAAKCRDRGSDAFKHKNIARAVKWYERALYHVDFDEGTWHFEV